MQQWCSVRRRDWGRSSVLQLTWPHSCAVIGWLVVSPPLQSNYRVCRLSQTQSRIRWRRHEMPCSKFITGILWLLMNENNNNTKKHKYYVNGNNNIKSPVCSWLARPLPLPGSGYALKWAPLLCKPCVYALSLPCPFLLPLPFCYAKLLSLSSLLSLSLSLVL